MSIRDGKVKLYLLEHRNVFVIRSLLFVQFFLTIILSVSLAAHIIWPERAAGAAPAPLMISYEGRLTDSSGNPMGGTGTAYCYRFSIYDASSAGNKLWPASSPGATTATTTDGVFNATIGQTDSLSSSIFDFSTTTTAYLQVDVGTTSPTCATGAVESLSPRQQINASPYAMTANNLGSSMRSDNTGGPTSGPVIKVGLGTGSPTPVYLDLDWKNSAEYIGQSCSVNGQMWYNSITSNALICEAGAIAGLGIQGTTTIAAVTTNSATPVSVGTINFSNSNNISFGISSNGVVTATATFAVGGSVSRLMWPQANVTALTSVPQGSLSIQYFPIGEPLTASRMDVMMSVSLGTSANASTAGMVISQWVGIYSKNAATLMSMTTASNQQTISWNSNSGSYSSLTGMRLFSMPININATPGDYYVAYEMSTAFSSFSAGANTTSLGGTFSIYGGNQIATAAGAAFDWGLSATSTNQWGGMGVYSAAVNSNLGNLSLSAIGQTGSNVSKANYWLQLRNI
jgi:hypothetical protein